MTWEVNDHHSRRLEIEEKNWRCKGSIDREGNSSRFLALAALTQKAEGVSDAFLRASQNAGVEARRVLWAILLHFMRKFDHCYLHTL